MPAGTCATHARQRGGQRLIAIEINQHGVARQTDLGTDAVKNGRGAQVALKPIPGGRLNAQHIERPFGKMPDCLAHEAGAQQTVDSLERLRHRRR